MTINLVETPNLRFLIAISAVLTTLCLLERASAQNASSLQFENRLREQIVNKTLEGFYQYQDVLTGNQSFSETYHGDGTLTYKDGNFVDKGKWWISNDQLCHRYNIDVPNDVPLAL